MLLLFTAAAIWCIHTRRLAAPRPAVVIDYTWILDFDEMGDSLCDAFGSPCDCTDIYRGSGTQLEAVENRVTFEGTWELVSGDCDPDFRPWLPDDGAAYHTVRFNSAFTTLDEWVAHSAASSHERIPESPKANNQWWMSALDAPYDDSTKVVNYTDLETVQIDIISLDIDHDLEIRFNE